MEYGNGLTKEDMDMAEIVAKHCCADSEYEEQYWMDPYTDKIDPLDDKKEIIDCSMSETVPSEDQADIKKEIIDLILTSLVTHYEITRSKAGVRRMVIEITNAGDLTEVERDNALDDKDIEEEYKSVLKFKQIFSGITLVRVSDYISFKELVELRKEKDLLSIIKSKCIKEKGEKWVKLNLYTLVSNIN
ncbi:hypothetical protein 1 [Soybean thrips rhabdo-like virus 2]|uniref:Uncharacterized protein n=1 Tax=Soybean thrips rhabdo-like virus 2 TaxID=2802236 RepID=A0A7T8G234_9RHAB|nr:hypothetical protein 1 [Soybean thrips rhabdo-like virus 2]